MRSSNKTLVFTGSILLIIVISGLYIQWKVLNNNWFEYNKPIEIEIVTWSEEGEHVSYNPITDNKTTKNILKKLDNSGVIEDYTKNDYIDNLPLKRGTEVQLAVRKTNEKGNRQGEILIHFSFCEFHNIAEIENEYYHLDQEFKNYIFKTLENHKKLTM